MDPFSAMMIAALLTWGTAGGGIKDTSAILKGQTPPSYAYRAAKLQASQKAAQRDHAVLKQAQERGEPLPAALEGRRIRVKDLVRHWWEDALEDADHWRSTRHASRGERKAKRKAWNEKKKAQIKKGYDLLKARGEDRFGPRLEQDQEEAGPVPDHGASEEPVPDNVVPLHGREQPGQEEGGEAQEKVLPPHPADPDFGPLWPDMTPEQQESINNSLDRIIAAQNRGQSASRTNSEEHAMIDLSDAPTLDAHTRALEAYASYLDKIAADMDALAAGMAQHQMGQIAVNAVTTAGVANSEAAADVRQRKEELLGAHTPVSEARSAAPDAADGDYLTRGR